MKLAAIACLALASCAGTVVNSPATGKPILVTGADMTNLHVHAAPDGSVDVTGDFKVSGPIKAQGQAMSAKWAAFGTALVGILKFWP